MRFVTPLLVLFLVLAASPSTADWQYTKWGMTPDQAIAASKGQLTKCKASECDGQATDTEAARLTGSYSSGEFLFTAFLYFDKKANKLSLVQLKLRDHNKAASLVGAMRAKYGEPASRSNTSIISAWVWRDKADQVSLLQIGAGSTADVSLSYKPRITDSNKGL